MDKPRFVLDSTVVINHLNKKLDIDTFFSSIPEFERYISVITFIEAWSKQPLTSADEESTSKLLSGFVSIDLIPSIQMETISIRQLRKLRLPDAVIAATAVILDATCLSNDPHLLNLVWPGFKAQTIVLTNP
jgi:predicted nucleic acid-binding protein